MSNSFDHLDNVVQELVVGGAIPKTTSEVFVFSFKNGVTFSWDIDKMKTLIDEMIDLHPNPELFLHEISPSDVAAIDDANAKGQHDIDHEYAASMPDHKKKRPVFVLVIPSDIGAPSTRIGHCVVCDGNHRIRAARLDGASMPSIIVPEYIERKCRIGVSQRGEGHPIPDRMTPVIGSVKSNGGILALPGGFD